MSLKVDECTRNNLCVDCDDQSCIRHGDPIQDCPKYFCDRPEPLKYDCDNCSFLKEYQKEMRKHYDKHIGKE